jgi:WD40 repeat protein
MTAIPHRFRLLCIPLLLAALPTHAQDKIDPAKSSPSHADLYGDPLPDGANLRLGTTRLRQSATLTALAVSSDGKTLASAGSDNVISLWNAENGKEIARCQGHKNMVGAILFLPGDKKLASGSYDGTIRLWDVAGREIACSDRAPQGNGTALVLTPDGKTLVSTGFAGGIRSWDADTLKLTSTIALGPLLPRPQLSPDGRWFATWELDKNIHLYSASTGKEERKWPTTVIVGFLAFSPDGTILAQNGRIAAGPIITLFDVTEGKEIRTIATKDGPGPLTFTPNGKYLAYGRGDSVVLYGVASGKELRQFAMSAQPRAFAFTPDGDRLVVAGIDQTIRLLDVSSNKEMFGGRGHEGTVVSIQFSADGKTILTNSSDRTIRYWEANTGKELRVAPWPEGVPTSLVLAADGRSAVGSTVAGLALFDLKDGDMTERFRVNAGQEFYASIAYSPDLTSFAAVGNAGLGMVVADVGTAKARFVQPAPASILAYAPDGKVLAIASVGQSVRILDATTGRQIREFGKITNFTNLCFSPDGRTLVTLVGEAHVWEVASGNERLRLPKPLSAVRSAAYSPDGGLLAVGLADGGILLRSPSNGEVLAQLRGHRGGVEVLAFSPDGALLASGSTDTTALVWDVAEHLRKARPALVERKKEELDAMWNDLSAADAVKAYQAVRSLAVSSGPVAAFLNERLRETVVDPKLIPQLIVALDDNSFKVREQATADLANLGELAAEAAQKALADKPTLEVQRRLETVVERQKSKTAKNPAVTLQRGLEALEALATHEAKQVLDKLAKDFAETPLGPQAKAAAERLARRLAIAH